MRSILDRTGEPVAGQQRDAFILTAGALETEDGIDCRGGDAQFHASWNATATIPVSAASRSSWACGRPTAHALTGFD